MQMRVVVKSKGKKVSPHFMFMIIPESPHDASQWNISDSQERLEPRRFLAAQSIPTEEQCEQESNASYDSRGLIFTQSSLPVNSTPPTSPATKESRTARRLLSTRGRSPVRSGTVPASQPRRGGNSPLLRHPRRATIHIGSIFHRPDSESEQPSFFLSTVTTTAEALSASSQSSLSTPKGLATSSSALTSPPATPPHPESPAQIPSSQVSSPASAPFSASSLAPRRSSTSPPPTAVGPLTVRPQFLQENAWVPTPWFAT